MGVFVARDSNENRRKIIRKSTKVLFKSSQNRRKIDLGSIRASKAVSGTHPDALGTALGHLYASPKLILGHPRCAKSGQEPSKSVPRTLRRRSKSLSGHSQHARKRRSHRPTHLEVFADRFLNVFGGRVAAPKCVSYRSCQCFIDVGRFACRALAACKNLDKTAVAGSKIEARGVLGTLGRASSSAKTAKSSEKACAKCPEHLYLQGNSFFVTCSGMAGTVTGASFVTV